MDASRFGLIGKLVEKATRLNAPLDKDDHQELAENKRSSTSCRS